VAREWQLCVALVGCTCAWLHCCIAAWLHLCIGAPHKCPSRALLQQRCTAALLLLGGRPSGEPAGQRHPLTYLLAIRELISLAVACPRRQPASQPPSSAAMAMHTRRRRRARFRLRSCTKWHRAARMPNLRRLAGPRYPSRWPRPARRGRKKNDSTPARHVQRLRARPASSGRLWALAAAELRPAHSSRAASTRRRSIRRAS